VVPTNRHRPSQISIALFSAAWATLDVLEMGLNRNDFSKTISDEVYFSGR
jgi:hypothetical protein